MSKLRVLDLFSGIGGFSLGLEATGGFDTVAFCEISEYPRKVLAKHWPDVPIYNDVRELTKEKLDGDGITDINVVCGGFPCQDISNAGKGAGIGADTRSGLWSECARLLGELRPTIHYAIFENVTALISGDNGRWFEQVLWDISQVGYDAEWHCIPASELGAHHHRDRVWIIAYPNNNGESSSEVREGIDAGGDSGTTRSEQASQPEGLRDSIFNGDVAYTDSERGRGRYSRWEDAKNAWQSSTSAWHYPREMGIWDAEPDVGRVANGVPQRSHRLKALGNAVVPQIPELIGRAILEANNGMV
jgi:DNA (cytosine-5)-methyltransferase 1